MKNMSEDDYVSIAKYERLLDECNKFETQYKEAVAKYTDLVHEHAKLMQQTQALVALLETYKQV